MAKILIIDDDANLRQFLLSALKERNHEVEYLERADGGVDLLAAGNFDLVLVDQNMPGMSGSDFLKIIRKQGLNIPAVLVTGYSKSDIVQDLKKLDVCVVTKPSGGHGEIWKELKPAVEQALQGEAEICAYLGQAFAAALKRGQKNLAPYLRKLLDRELLTRALSEASGNEKQAADLLGVSLNQLLEEHGTSSKDRVIEFRTKALLLIHNRPELTVDEIAQQIGCSKAKLYRDDTIARALRGRKTGNFRPRASTTEPDDDED